eukprot:12889927-Prorocentrum_lima.AAC.1
MPLLSYARRWPTWGTGTSSFRESPGPGAPEQGGVPRAGSSSADRFGSPSFNPWLRTERDFLSNAVGVRSQALGSRRCTK